MVQLVAEARVEIKRKACSVYGVILFCGLVCPRSAAGRDSKSIVVEMRSIGTGQDGTQRSAQKNELPPCSDAQSGKTAEEHERERKASESLPANYRNWLAEDAVYIITPGERCVFLRLPSDLDRNQFIEQFWYRRDPNPYSLENAFKQEHYRRIVWANEKYGTKVPGWKTDRGRIYICYGPPDEIESHPIDQPSWKPWEGEPGDVKYSWEKWHYRHVDNIGENVDIEFVEPPGSVDYSMRLTPQDKDRLVFNPERSRASREGTEAGPQIVSYIGVEPSPVVKYKDLEAVVTARIIRDQVHFRQRIEYEKATHASTVAKISVDIPDDQLSPRPKEQDSVSGYEIFGRIANPSGRIVFDFERSSEVDEQNKPGRGNSSRQATIALDPGSYELAIVVKDIASGKVGVTHTTFEVPRFEELATGN
jgi:GWxTD domain-containing protein